MNHLCWYPSVQEQPIKLGNVATPGRPLFEISGSSPNHVTLDFTDVSCQGQAQPFFDDGNAVYLPIVSIDDSVIQAVNFSITRQPRGKRFERL